jgi:flagellar biosynthesis GTPase FlhF
MKLEKELAEKKVLREKQEAMEKEHKEKELKEAQLKAEEEEKERKRKEIEENEAKALKEKQEEEERSRQAAIEAEAKAQKEKEQNEAEKSRQAALALAAAPPMCCGYMSKQGQIFRTWKRRFFVLESGELTYYVRETFEGSRVGDQKMGTPLYLKGYSVTQPEKDRLLISIVNRKMTVADYGNGTGSGHSPRGRAVSSVEAIDTGKTRQLLLEITDPDELTRWESAIRDHINFCDQM